jgi:hypothetical protein
MKSRNLFRVLAVVTIVAACLLMFSDIAAAQCAMCRSSFAGNPAFARNLNLGVLVLLAPPVSIFCAIFVLAFRHRKG